MNYVNESLNQFENTKFFNSLLEEEKVEGESEEKEKMSPDEKKKLALEIEKQGNSVIKKLYTNWKLFKTVAGDKMQSYRDFWAEQKHADETIGQKGMFYNLYDSNYIVGVVKNDAGKAEMKVYNTSAQATDEFETFVCSNKEVIKNFTKFFKGDVEGKVKEVIANHKSAIEAKKAADIVAKKEEEKALKKAKLDSFISESDKK